MGISGYAVIILVVLIIALGFYSTMRFNRKPPMTSEEYEEYEKSKKK